MEAGEWSSMLLQETRDDASVSVSLSGNTSHSRALHRHHSINLSYFFSLVYLFFFLLKAQTCSLSCNSHSKKVIMEKKYFTTIHFLHLFVFADKSDFESKDLGEVGEWRHHHKSWKNFWWGDSKSILTSRCAFNTSNCVIIGRTITAASKNFRGFGQKTTVPIIHYVTPSTGENAERGCQLCTLIHLP